MDKSVFVVYNIIKRGDGMHYYIKTSKDSEASSDKYIHVNNFGYSEDVTDMRVRRERGRVDYQLIYVKSGSLTITENEGDSTVPAGSVCLYRPGEAQIYGSYNGAVEFCWIHFSGSGVEEMLSFFEERCYTVGQFPEFLRYCNGALSEFETGKKYTELFYEGELIALIARIAERVERDRDKDDLAKIRPALNAINSSRTTRMSNSELAELCGFSRFYFMKVFKAITGTTPQQYYISQIIDKGCYLLGSTSYNVSQIARLCGIEDSLYFSRIFKKHTGLSPLAYRKKGMH